MNRVNKRVSDMVSPLYHGLEDGVVYRFYVYEGDQIAGEDFEFEEDAIEFAQNLVDRGTDYVVEVEKHSYSTYEDSVDIDDADVEVVWSSEDYKVSDSRVSDMTKPVHLRGYAKMRREERRAKNAELRNEDFDEKEKDEKQEEVNDSYRVKDAVVDFDLYEELDAAFSEPDFSGAVYAYRKVDGGVAIEMRKSSYDNIGGSDGVAEMIYNLTGIYVNVVSKELKEPLANPSIVELVLTPDSRVYDSKKIKDADEADTDDVIDGILVITFKDGLQEDGLKAVQEHANEQGDGYETYEVKEQDGKVGVDMCAQTSDPNSFVKELLKAWGVLDAVADVDFKMSDLMKEAEQQEEVSDSKKITDSTYGTSFTLTNPVNDYNAASDYLQADDMTQYLNNDLNYLGLSHLEGKIKEIKWVLEDEQTGYIVLYTTEPLAQEDLDKISEWISGQCSDGLGEGFEQQPFAEVRYYDEDEYNSEYGYNDYDTDMASFDWETNDYKLKLYDSARIKDGCGEDAESVGKVNNTDILRDNKNGGVYVWVNGKKKKFSTKKDAEEYIKKTYNEDGTPKK